MRATMTGSLALTSKAAARGRGQNPTYNRALTRFKSHEMKVAGMQIGEHHMLQGDGVVGIGGDDHIAPHLLALRLHLAEIGEHVVVELDHIGAGREVGDHVLAEIRTEDEGVATASAEEVVVARPALDHVVGVIADQKVVEGRTDNVLEVAEDVALGVAPLRQPGAEVDHDAGGGVGIAQGVDAFVAAEEIGAGAALDVIVAGPALNDVVETVADQRIAVRGADNVLEVAEDIALGVAALRQPLAEVDEHARRRLGIAQGVDAFVAAEEVGAGAALDGVVAAAALDVIVAGPALNDVVETVADQRIAVRGAENGLEVAEDIALGVAAKRQSLAEVDEHARRRVGIAQGVDAFVAAEEVGAGAALDGVVAAAALDVIVAGPALNDVVETIAHQDVVEGRADDV